MHKTILFLKYGCFLCVYYLQYGFIFCFVGCSFTFFILFRLFRFGGNCFDTVNLFLC